MSETIAEPGAVEEPVVESAAKAVSDEQLIGMLVDRARSDGLQLTGEGAVKLVVWLVGWGMLMAL